MRAIAWKELREHLRWALLGLLANGLGLLVGLWPGRVPWSYFRSESLLSERFLALTTSQFAVWGGILGFLLVLRDHSGDRWSFLLFRPIRPGTIFQGKVLAAAALYFPSTLVPLFLAAGWAATPGHLAAPFDWRMSLAGLADALTGFVFCLAAMLTGLRQARWYATRAIGLVVAVLCAALVQEVREFGEALAAILVSAALLYGAAWEAFLARAGAARRPLPLRFALVAVLFTGLAALAEPAIELLALLPAPKRQTYSIYALTPQGEVCVIRYDHADYPPKLISAESLEGRPLELGTDRLSFWEKIVRGIYLDFEPGTRWADRYRDADRFFTRVGKWSTLEDGFYRFGARTVELYDRKDKRLLAIAGPQGFALPEHEGPPFPGELLLSVPNGPSFLVFADAAYGIDEASRRLTPHRMREPLVNAVWEGNSQGEGLIAACSRRELFLLRRDGRVLLSSPLRFTAPDYDRVECSMLPTGDRFFVWYFPSSSTTAPVPGKSVRLQLQEVTAHGEVVRTYALPVKRPALVQEPLSPLAALAALTPPPLCLANAIGRGLPADHPLAACAPLSLVSAAVFAVLAFWVCRRFAFRPSMCRGWAGAVFALGPLGLLAMLAAHEWPARLPCFRCARRRVVSRDTCEHCGAGLAPVAPDGTEIFDVEHQGTK
ncbi:MAG: hypothetical protein HYZ53_14200 [Planctomycetes bacterium]|nr:hypothetical protein [Planctomycetota bacterium]